MGRRLIAAAVVLVIAACPTVLDAKRGWEETPEDRPLIVGSYLVAVLVAIFAAEMLVN